MNTAVLALEDGTVFEGRSFGAPAERSGEVVFNTALTGYQEVFTDPSYSGQIVILTNPQIGNYGTSAEDNESARPYIEGLVVREFSPLASNWRSDSDAGEFLARHGIPIIGGPRHARAGAPPADARRDARRAFRRGVRHREAGGEGARDPDAWSAWIWRAASPRPSATRGPSPWKPARPPSWCRARAEPRCHVVAYDFGIKHNILRRLVHVGLPRDGGAGAHLRRRRAGAQARRRVPLQRSRRPRAAARAGGQHPQADRPQARSSASAWATSCSAWRWAARRTS